MYVGDLGLCATPDCIEDAQAWCPKCRKPFCLACLSAHTCEERPET